VITEQMVLEAIPPSPERICSASFSIKKEDLKRDTIGSPPRECWSWACPSCGVKTYGDESVFEITRDPCCIYCRVKFGEYKHTGLGFKRVEPNTKGEARGALQEKTNE